MREFLPTLETQFPPHVLIDAVDFVVSAEGKKHYPLPSLMSNGSVERETQPGGLILTKR